MGSSGQTKPPCDNAWLAVSAGSLHSCGIQYDGSLSCWGANTAGQTDVPCWNEESAQWAECGTAGAVIKVGWQQVACGETHTCGILRDGTLKCFGDNRYAQSDVPVGLIAAECDPTLGDFVTLEEREYEGQVYLVNPVLDDSCGCETIVDADGNKVGEWVGGSP